MPAFAAVLDVLHGEFTDLSPDQAVQLAVRLLVAGAMAAVLGWERERRGKSAGLRTHILVAVGSAGFTAVPQQAGLGVDAVSRILQGLVAGIGFLGAGCILKFEEKGQVRGLTTAAGVWLTAAVGVAAGLGRELSALVLGAAGWFTLYVIGWLEARAGVSPPHQGEKPGGAPQHPEA